MIVNVRRIGMKEYALFSTDDLYEEPRPQRTCILSHLHLFTASPSCTQNRKWTDWWCSSVVGVSSLWKTRFWYIVFLFDHIMPCHSILHGLQDFPYHWSIIEVNWERLILLYSWYTLPRGSHNNIGQNTFGTHYFHYNMNLRLWYLQKACPHRTPTSRVSAKEKLDVGGELPSRLGLGPQFCKTISERADGG